MKKAEAAQHQPAENGWTRLWEGSQGKRYLFLAGVLALLFHRPLSELLRYSLSSDLYSYIPLIPLVSAGLIWLNRADLCRMANGSPGVALVPILLGAWLLIHCWTLVPQRAQLNENDRLSFLTAAFLFLLIGGAFMVFGAGLMRAVAFPASFLMFTVPLPTFFTDWLEGFLQHASADAASALFTSCGATVFHEGLFFRLPGIAIEVAKECSGIHSSLVLMITSLVAGHLFLRSPWKKTALALAVIPLGIIRNGFRIFTLGMLCVHVNPNIIDSPLHHRGGPIFFVLSLVPFFALLFLLRRSERPGKVAMAASANPPAKNAQVSLDPRTGSQRAV